MLKTKFGWEYIDYKAYHLGEGRMLKTVNMFKRLLG